MLVGGVLLRARVQLDESFRVFFRLAPLLDAFEELDTLVILQLEEVFEVLRVGVGNRCILLVFVHLYVCIIYSYELFLNVVFVSLTFQVIWRKLRSEEDHGFDYIGINIIS